MEENQIFATIKRNVLEVVPDVKPDAISMDCSLSDLGCNSIDRAEVVTLTLEQLHIDVPLHEFHRGEKIRQIVALMRSYA
jgi:polyketide biosynthesis acyl carrier protein